MPDTDTNKDHLNMHLDLDIHEGETNKDVLGRIADTVVKMLEAISDATEFSPCTLHIAVAGRLMDDMMKNGHESCAFHLAYTASVEAQRLAKERNANEAMAMNEKTVAQPTEH